MLVMRVWSRRKRKNSLIIIFGSCTLLVVSVVEGLVVSPAPPGLAAVTLMDRGLHCVENCLLEGGHTHHKREDKVLEDVEWFGLVEKLPLVF